jgi:endonuclease YncB( thermonuclease family)
MRIAQILLMRESCSIYTTRRLVAFALAAGLLVGGPWAVWARSDGGPAERAQAELVGMAKVVDGDTLVVNGTRVRLEGIDAPEVGQTCKRRMIGAWACGTESTNALARLIEGKPVRCDSRGLDKYGRTLGVCFLGDLDVNAWMVRQGHAWAFIKYSTSYVQDETQARAQRIGIWQGQSTPPWEYRENRWASAEPQAAEGCAIKGNVTVHGKIYHMPWSPWYAQIRMDADRGRRWFCTEAEAVAAGWRPVNVH